MVEEVIVPVELGQLTSDLYSSVIWSKVGLVNFKQYKKKVFEEFEKKELEFYTKYPKVTPFANEQIEMEYTKQVQFVGEEEEFNLDSFILFDQEEEEQVEDSLEEVTHVPESVLEHYDSISHEDLDLEEDDFMEEEPEEIPQPSISTKSETSLTGVEPLQKPSPQIRKISKEVEENSLQTNKTVSNVDFEFTSIDELLGHEEGIPTQVVKRKTPKPKVVSSEPKESPTKEVTYYNGMSLRQFLRENPRSSIELTEKYFSRKEIMKEVQLGRVIKRGKKLFI
jgi:hypothetical protein